MTGVLAAIGRAGLAAGLIAVLGACLASASGGPTTPAPEAPVQTDRPFVLVVLDAADRRLAGTEAYGDSQSYLRSFIERRRGELAVHPVTPEQAARLLPKWPQGLRIATLFAHPQGRGLLHRGLVLEPQVYLIGKAFAERAAAAPEAARYGLEPFEWK